MSVPVWGTHAPRLAHLDAVGALLGDVGDGAHSARVHHDLVVVDERVLVDLAKDVAARDVVADLVVERFKVPLDAAVERVGADTARDVDRLGLFGDRLERTLDTVVNIGHETWARVSVVLAR